MTSPEARQGSGALEKLRAIRDEKREKEAQATTVRKQALEEAVKEIVDMAEGNELLQKQQDDSYRTAHGDPNAYGRLHAFHAEQFPGYAKELEPLEQKSRELRGRAETLQGTIAQFEAEITEAETNESAKDVVAEAMAELQDLRAELASLPTPQSIADEKMGLRHHHEDLLRAQEKTEKDPVGFAADTVFAGGETNPAQAGISKEELVAGAKEEKGRRNQARWEAGTQKEEEMKYQSETEYLTQAKQTIDTVRTNTLGALRAIETSVSPSTPEGRAFRDQVKAKFDEAARLLSQTFVFKREAKEQAARQAATALNTEASSLLNEKRKQVQKIGGDGRQILFDLERQWSDGVRIGQSRFYHDPVKKAGVESQHKKVKAELEELLYRTILNEMNKFHELLDLAKPEALKRL